MAKAVSLSDSNSTSKIGTAETHYLSATSSWLPSTTAGSQNMSSTVADHATTTATWNFSNGTSVTSKTPEVSTNSFSNIL